MVSADYTGRTIDLLVFQNTAVYGDPKLRLDWVDTANAGGQITTGIQKVSQTFLQLFLTALGSIASEPDRGTDFYPAVQRGELHNDVQVRTYFGAAAEQIRTYLSVLEAGLPDDERFESAELDSFNLDKDNAKLTLVVKVNSAAGESRIVYIPVPIVIL